MFQRAPDHIISAKINGFPLFRAYRVCMRSAITMESPTVVDSRALVEGLVLQETSRKQFYELEGALQMVARRR